MSDRLKVGFLKEVIIMQETGSVTALAVDDETKWFCSEIVDSQIQERLNKKGIFGTDNIYILVDDELAQTPGVRIIDENTSSKLDEIIREYLKELYTGLDFEKSLNNDHLNVLQKLGALTKILITTKQENDLPSKDKWNKVITAEL